MINTIGSLVLLFLFINAYLRVTDRKKPRGTSKMVEHLFSLRDGTKVMASFYFEYEITNVQAIFERKIKALPDEEKLASLSVLGLHSVLVKKGSYRDLNKEKIGKEASKKTKKREKKMNPKQDIVGEIKIVIGEIRRPTPEEMEKDKQP